jgi:membrane associated rhomboid family serine protease
MRKIGRWIAIVFLAVTGLFGIANAVNEVGIVETALQMSVEVGDALWGILGLLTAIGMWRRRPWILTTSVAWAIALTYTGTVASFAFHDPTFADPSTKMGTIAAFAAIGAISALIVWAVRVAMRSTDVPKSTPV